MTHGRMKGMDRIREMLDKSEYIRALGIEMLELSEEYAKGRMPFDAKYCNPFGTMHGGCLYSLADTVAGTLACNAGGNVVTVEGSLHFLEVAKDTAYVYCEANMKKCGKTLIVVDVEVKDDGGKLLDSGSYSFFRTD